MQRSQDATMPRTPIPPMPPGRPIHPTPPPAPPFGVTPAPQPAARPVAFHTPPPSGPPSGPMWTAAPPPSGPPRQGNKVPWIPIAAAAGVFVLVLGALGIWWLVKPDDTSSSGPTTTATESTTTRRDDRPVDRRDPAAVRVQTDGAVACRLRQRRVQGGTPACNGRPGDSGLRSGVHARRARERALLVVRRSEDPGYALRRGDQRELASCSNARAAASTRRPPGTTPRPPTESKAASRAAPTTTAPTWCGPRTRTCCSRCAGIQPG